MKKDTTRVNYKGLSEVEKTLYVEATVKHNMMLSIRKHIITKNIGITEIAEKLDVTIDEALSIIRGDVEKLESYLKLCFVLGINLTVAK